MTTESKEEKAVRYLGEGRLHVQRVVPDSLVVAQVLGTGAGPYTLGYDPKAHEWRCNCPARTKECAHLIALQLVVGPRS